MSRGFIVRPEVEAELAESFEPWLFSLYSMPSVIPRAGKKESKSLGFFNLLCYFKFSFKLFEGIH